MSHRPRCVHARARQTLEVTASKSSEVTSPFESKRFSAAPVPPAFDGATLVVVIVRFQVALGVALTTSHHRNRQYMQTLALFEIRDQGNA